MPYDRLGTRVALFVLLVRSHLGIASSTWKMENLTVRKIILLCSAQNAMAVIFLLKLEINSLKPLDILGMIPASSVLYAT